VQYLPTATARHAHGRASASGGLLGLFTNSLTRTHVTSAVRFFRKFGPRPARPTTARPGVTGARAGATEGRS
jgi:hypothetical protein